LGAAATTGFAVCAAGLGAVSELDPAVTTGAVDSMSGEARRSVSVGGLSLLPTKASVIRMPPPKPSVIVATTVATPAK
jgi:hypothetical protein